jgi:hypothetical protein
VENDTERERESLRATVQEKEIERARDSENE